jgi:hypothetical protein
VRASNGAGDMEFTKDKVMEILQKIGLKPEEEIVNVDVAEGAIVDEIQEMHLERMITATLHDAIAEWKQKGLGINRMFHKQLLVETVVREMDSITVLIVTGSYLKVVLK